eukprot:TRINITY_DN4063_c0_g1_i2.p1 TRINITY_DN4063_c0_g1~~TRINITY_DN4063_c0_g1_i2.p1  ORF type:complete len:157 (-),score=36.00 TRINITY_DN4063_c0_g1_i2:112-582(-)
MFLHNRNTAGEFAEVMHRNRHRFTHGVVHSFTGDADELHQLLKLNLYIGINGCSLKTAENLAVAALIPADRLMLETDAPWCDIRTTHASAKHVKTQFPARRKDRFVSGEMVKGRNEPCTMVQVLEALAGARGEDVKVLGEQVLRNTTEVFFPTTRG